jgi:hypothetical protein
MTTATLLVFPAADDDRAQAAFAFDHAMTHRNYYQFMNPLHQWSVMPYFIDPAPSRAETAIRAGPWHLNHQHAHNDFTHSLPVDWGMQAPGIPSDQILVDSDLTDRGSLAWWTFANHQEHYLANATVLPAISEAQTVLIDLGGGQIIPIVQPPPWIDPARWTLPPFW